MAINDRNGIAAALAGSSYAELVVALAELTSQWVDAVEASSALTRSRACSTGGTETLTVDDRDGNGRISAGDVLRVQLDRCYSRWVDEPLSGSASFTWTSRTDRANFVGQVRFGSDFAMVDASGRLSVVGNLTVRHAVSGAVTEVQGSSDPSAPLGVSEAAPSSYRDVLQQIDVLKVMDIAQARITTTMQLQVSSELLGGRIEVRTPMPWVAGLSTYPESGNMSISGITGTRLILQAVRQAAIDGQTKLDLDIQGDGIVDYTAAIPWSDVSIGAFGALENRIADEAATSAFTPFWPRYEAFSLVTSPGPRSLHNILAPLRWQFSVPVTLPTSGPLFLRRETSSARANPWLFANGDIPVTVNHQGAFVELTVDDPLEPGTTYRLVDVGGSMPTLSTSSGPWRWDFTITADDNIQANVTVPQPGVVSNGLNATLTASHAYTGTSSLTVSWRQVSGPPAVLSSTTGNAITVSAPTSGGSNGDAEFELRMQTIAGDLDFARVKLPLIGDPLNTTQALFSPVSTGAWTIGASWSLGNTFLADYRNGGNTGRVFYNIGFNGETGMQLSFGAFHGSQPPIEAGLLWLYIPSGSFAATTYSVGRPGANATVLYDLTTPTRCSPDTGTVVIHEIELGTTNEITRLALDFDRDACPGAPAHSGSIRINSLRPLRVP